MNNKEFWLRRWIDGDIDFHKSDVNYLLTKYWSELKPSFHDSVFVPLCGKSKDLIWLSKFHHQVTGIDLSSIAVKSFFEESKLNYKAYYHEAYELYKSNNLSIYSGDIFKTSLDSFDLIYDRAALIALSPDLRELYAQRIVNLLKPNGKIFLINLDYEPAQQCSPPFSVPYEDLKSLFLDMKMVRLHRAEAKKEHPKIQQGLSYFAEEVWVIYK